MTLGEGLIKQEVRDQYANDGIPHQQAREQQDTVNKIVFLVSPLGAIMEDDGKW